MFLVFLNYFDMLILKIIFKNKKILLTYILIRKII
jgi:energy-converting hydrogenase Eha subunit E